LEFCAHFKEDVVKQHADWTSQQVSQKLKQMWQQLTTDEKEVSLIWLFSQQYRHGFPKHPLQNPREQSNNNPWKSLQLKTNQREPKQPRKTKKGKSLTMKLKSWPSFSLWYIL
jgi:CDP-glycerol glycerophosphotransferase (TagB/SpsB family)